MTLKKRKEPLKCKNKNKKNKKEHDKRRDSVGEVDYHILPQLVAVLRYLRSVIPHQFTYHFKF
jgi:CelD/BcsL family acetyltransferase involved in cellulose biosynthesis